MAIQAHNITWTLFASKFKYIEINPSCSGVTNYYARMKTNPGKDIAHFVNAFAKTVEEHSACERAKYADEYSKPSPNDIIMGENVSRKIGRTVHRYRAANSEHKKRSCTIRCAEKICSHRSPDSQCQCPVRYEDRTASMFSIAPVPEDGPRLCSVPFKEKLHEIEFTAMVKTLLLHGEMDVLLSLAAYNPKRLASNWSISITNCQPSEQGWGEVRDLALYPFVCLNMLYALRMASGHDNEPENQDYRKTKAYQVALLRCTAKKEFGCYSRESAFDPETFPHRQFFGVYRGQYKNTQYPSVGSIADSDTNAFYGKIPLDRFQKAHDSSDQYTPTVSEVDEVFLSLRRCGLPTELVLEILERADYKWQRRSAYSDNPMHPDNREELFKYLKFCWILLVRCDLLVRACGKRIDWVNDVSHCVNELFGVRDKALRRIEINYGDRESEIDVIRQSASWITWLSA